MEFYFIFFLSSFYSLHVLNVDACVCPVKLMTAESLQITRLWGRAAGLWDRAVGLWDRAVGLWDRAVGLWDRAVGLWDRAVAYNAPWSFLQQYCSVVH